MTDYQVGFGKPPPEHQFKAGNNANPGGKPITARNALNAKFLKALSKSFDEGGEEAIERARREDPIGYVRVFAALMPKEIEVKKSMDEISDEQLSAAIESVRAILAAGTASQNAGARTIPAQEPEPA